MDSTTLRIGKGKNKETYSGYKHHHGIKFQLVINHKSMIKHVSKSYSSSIHDKKLFINEYKDLMSKIDKNINILEINIKILILILMIMLLMRVLISVNFMSLGLGELIRLFLKILRMLLLMGLLEGIRIFILILLLKKISLVKVISFLFTK